MAQWEIDLIERIAEDTGIQVAEIEQRPVVVDPIFERVQAEISAIRTAYNAA